MLKIEVSKLMCTDSRLAGTLKFSSRSVSAFSWISSKFLLTGTWSMKEVVVMTTFVFDSDSMVHFRLLTFNHGRKITLAWLPMIRFSGGMIYATSKE
jgi:hypothetical protein